MVIGKEDGFSQDNTEHNKRENSRVQLIWFASFRQARKYKSVQVAASDLETFKNNELNSDNLL